jgi:hypothetical protein
MLALLKYLLLIAIIFILDVELFGQSQLVPEWKKSRSSNLQNGNSEGWGVDVDPNGNVYWSASFDSTSTDRLYDIMTYKYDSAGNEKWSSYYGGSGLQHSFVMNARDTFLYVGGRENTVWPYWATECNMLLLKIDKNTGALVKHKNIGFGTGGYDEMDAIEMNGTSLYCSGWAQVTPGVGNYEMGFLKLTYSLEIQEQKTFGDLSAGSAEHQDGHMVLDNSTIFAAGLWNGHTGINWLADGRCLLGKFDLDLNYLDTVLFGPSLAAPFDLENALGSASDGNSIYVTGYSCPVSSTDMQVIIARFDKSLNPKWIAYFGGPRAETARGITCQGGFVYVCGATNTPDYAAGGGYDALLLRLDTATGTQVDYYTWGDSRDNEFRDLAIRNNEMYISGTTGTNMFSGGSSDEAFLIKINLATMNGTRDDPDLDSVMTLFPNPAVNEIRIKSTRIIKRIILKNYLGEKVKEMDSNGHDVTISVKGLSSGVYFIEAFEKDTGSPARKVFILK